MRGVTCFGGYLAATLTDSSSERQPPRGSMKHHRIADDPPLWHERLCGHRVIAEHVEAPATGPNSRRGVR